MPSINTGLMTQYAKQRFQGMTLPAGTDRNRYVTYIGGICGAIGNAWRTWQTQASLTGVVVQAVTATGGKLVGPALGPRILSQAPPGWEPYSRAIAIGIQNQLMSFCDNVRVPGLPWYPAFAAFPGPMAPPTPNVPTPLAAIGTAGAHYLKENGIATAIINKYSKAKPACGDEVAKAIANGVEQASLIWLVGTMVTGVMGAGDIPTYAPPYVPVGPVVRGVATGGMLV